MKEANRKLENIKFRGKSLNTNEWVYGNLVVCNNGDCFIGTLSQTAGAYKNDTYQVNPKTIGQYTGLKDSKETNEFPEGEEIYEGDLFYYHEVLRKVEYREDNTSWMGIVVKGHCGSSNFYLRDITNDYNIRLRAEIVGNIY